MSDRSIPNFAEAMGRIQIVTGCRTQQELAALLGIRQSSISDAKKRGSIPSDWLLTLLRKKGINPDWVLTGQGARLLQPVDCLPVKNCSTEQLIREIIQRAIVNIE